VIDSSGWGAISITQSAKVAFKVLTGGLWALRSLRSGEPGLLIPIDFGFFNIRLCRAARRAGWKVIYFVPPGCWRRDRQGVDIPKVADAIVTPFPWSAEIYRAMGANVHWFGHPLKQLVAGSSVPERTHGGIAVLPGSRKHEVSLNLPLIAAAIAGRAERVEIAVAPSLSIEWVRGQWPGEATFTQADTYGVLRRARAAVVCSGTATLEAALCGCPTVVVYKLSPTMSLEVAIVRPKAPFVSLPNILLNRWVLPELVHKKARVESVRDELAALLADGPARDAQLEAFREISEILGPSDAITQTARYAVEFWRR
jgi:lipid-A-disaccharide synthase